MYGFPEYEIIRILEERNDFEYIDSKSKEYEEEYKRITDENKARIMCECRSFHRQLSKPIPEDYFLMNLFLIPESMRCMTEHAVIGVIIVCLYLNVIFALLRDGIMVESY